MDLTRELQKTPVHGPDYKRITKKQVAYLLGMLDELAEALEYSPGIFTEARAHLMINSIEPHVKALRSITEAYEPEPEEYEDMERDFVNNPDF